MGRFLEGSNRWVGIVGLPLLLAVGAWFLVRVAFPGVVEGRLSAALGVPVHVLSARPTWGPFGLLASGVALGAEGAPVVSAARVHVRVGLFALLRGDLSRARLEVREPRVHAAAGQGETVDRMLRHLAHLPGPESPIRVDAVRVDEMELEIGGDEPSLIVAGFDLEDVEVTRAGEGLAAVAASLRLLGARGRLVGELDATGEVPGLLLGAETDGISLAGLARGAGWRLAGRASGRLWYERSRPAQRTQQSVGGDLAFEALRVARGEELLARADSLRLEEARLDRDTGRVVLQQVTGKGIGLSPELARVVLDAAAGGAFRVASGRLRDLEIDPPAAGPRLLVESLELDEVATDGGTGAFRIRLAYGDGRLHLEAHRPSASLPGTARLVAEGLPVASLLEDRTAGVNVKAGSLDAELDLRGPPGLVGAGNVRVRGLEVVTHRDGREEPLLEIGELHADVARFSAGPVRLRLRSARLVEPSVWLRRGADGLELVRLLGEAREGTAGTLERLLEEMGDAPDPDTEPPPLGIRVSAGEVFVRDRSVTPPFAVRLRRIEALAHGPAGTAGELSLTAQSRGAAASSWWLDARNSTEGASLRLVLRGGRLVDFDAYLQEWTGYEARAGRIDVETEARLSAPVKADVHVRFEGVRLEPTDEADMLEGLLGAPLPEIVAQLQGADGTGRLDLTIPGDEERACYGFAESSEQALREAVDREQRSAADSEHSAGEGS